LQIFRSQFVLGKGIPKPQTPNPTPEPEASVHGEIRGRGGRGGRGRGHRGRGCRGRGRRGRRGRGPSLRISGFPTFPPRRRNTVTVFMTFVFGTLNPKTQNPKPMQICKLAQALLGLKASHPLRSADRAQHACGLKANEPPDLNSATFLESKISFTCVFENAFGKYTFFA
jgi:hypothetical protein